MSLSLRDQLLQAGLINEKQAKQAGKHQGQQRREQAKNPAAAAAEQQRIAAHKAAEAAKAARDAELNRQQQEKAQQKERRAQVKQLVEQHRLPPVAGEDLFNFVDGKRIRRIPVNAQMRERFGRGELAIVRSDGRYHVVPLAIGERIRERDEHSFVAIPGADKSAAVDENDPYKDFVVPDDLMW